MKTINKLRILIIHLWFIASLYFFITEDGQTDYIGKEENGDGVFLYELMMYISGFILVVYYVSTAFRNIKNLSYRNSSNL